MLAQSWKLIFPVDGLAVGIEADVAWPLFAYTGLDMGTDE
jgi:hypothetical protein